MIAAAMEPCAVERREAAGRMPVVLVVQFDGHGDQAGEVEQWLQAHFAQASPRAWAAPGLTCQLTMPDDLGQVHNPDDWSEVMAALNTTRDVAVEILTEAFVALGLDACGIVAQHLTRRADRLPR